MQVCFVVLSFLGQVHFQRCTLQIEQTNVHITSVYLQAVSKARVNKGRVSSSKWNFVLLSFLLFQTRRLACWCLHPVLQEVLWRKGSKSTAAEIKDQGGCFPISQNMLYILLFFVIMDVVSYLHLLQSCRGRILNLNSTDFLLFLLFYASGQDVALVFHVKAWFFPSFSCYKRKFSGLLFCDYVKKSKKALPPLSLQSSFSY